MDIKTNSIDKIRAISGSVIAAILIFIGGKGYFDGKDGWGWWIFGAVVALAIAFDSDNNEPEPEEK